MQLPERCNQDCFGVMADLRVLCSTLTMHAFGILATHCCAASDQYSYLTTSQKPRSWPSGCTSRHLHPTGYTPFEGPTRFAGWSGVSAFKHNIYKHIPPSAGVHSLCMLESSCTGKRGSTDLPFLGASCQAARMQMRPRAQPKDLAGHDTSEPFLDKGVSFLLPPPALFSFTAGTMTLSSQCTLRTLDGLSKPPILKFKLQMKSRTMGRL